MPLAGAAPLLPAPAVMPRDGTVPGCPGRAGLHRGCGSAAR